MRLFLLSLSLFFTHQLFAYDIHGHMTGAFYKAFEVEGRDFDNHTDFEKLSKAGLTLSHSVDDQFLLKFGVISKANTDHGPLIDIAKVVYTPNSWFDFGAGRMKLPVWMHSEYKDVGHLFPWLNLPDQVYSQNPIDYFDGAQIGFHFRPESLFGVDLFLYTGGVRENERIRGRQYESRTTLSEKTEIFFNFQNLHGAQLQLVSNNLTFSASYLQARDQGFSYTDIHSNLGAGTQQIRIKTDTNLGTVYFVNIGGKLSLNNWMMMSEWIQISTEGDFYRNYQGYYVTTGYVFRDSWMPHLTYSRNTKVSSTAFGGNTDSSTIGLNYFQRENVTWKFEYILYRFLTPNSTRESINSDPRTGSLSAGIEIVF